MATGVTLAARLPRPNPGPELPPAPDASAQLWLGLAMLLGLAALTGFWLRRNRGSRTGAPWPPTELGEPGPEVVRAATEARRLLAQRFNENWSALTTEQIAEHPDLIAGLGPELTSGLLGLLRAADRHKFGDAPDPLAAGLDQWGSVLAGLRAAAGANSTRTGR